MKRNYSRMLKQLQMAYMPLTMKNENEDYTCVHCWKSTCNCANDKTAIKTDPFLNFTGEELYYV
ncbi:hypothetical protein V1503_19190 [Bacillus sp. SCS-151]|uniref:hypothetical protein n=1 Tax=Nanhaiella sioensis TaxID=3115293 RepID=UPI00397A47E9